MFVIHTPSQRIFRVKELRNGIVVVHRPQTPWKPGEIRPQPSIYILDKANCREIQGSANN